MSKVAHVNVETLLGVTLIKEGFSVCDRFSQHKATEWVCPSMP